MPSRSCDLFSIFFPPSKGVSTRNLALIGQAVSETKMFVNNGHIHVFCHGAGADNPLR